MNKSSVISVWKPPGITSYDVIRSIKRFHGNISKIGHCGTLDPFAEGILIICTGDESKNASKYVDLPKTYIAEIIFGSETDTLDSTGSVIKADHNKCKITIKDVESALSKFSKSYIQSPPYYSAKKINGVKMYKLARNQIFIRLKGVEVDIYDLSIINYSDMQLKIKIKCGAGTYVRSLARDIAYELNTFAYVDKLVRMKVGNYEEKNSITFKDINKQC